MSTQAANTLVAQASATGTLSVATESATPFSTFTNVPPLSTPVSRCDSADFESDVTYPDGSSVGRSTTFVKTWRIRNTGTCTWTTGYVLMFDNGDRMDAPATVPLTTDSVQPDATVDVSVNLKAPATPGTN